MTTQEAEAVFRDWQDFAEINSKLIAIFSASIPESFLPHSKDTLEEALNIIAKHHHDHGNHQMSETIQEHMASIMFYKDDEEALNGIVDSFVLRDVQLRKAHLKNLKDARDSWAKFKKR